MAGVTKGFKPLDLKLLEKAEQTSEAERTKHEASCHCGSVEYTVILNKPFPQYSVNKCNCSICEHNGYLLVYPRRVDVVITKGGIYLRCLHASETTANVFSGEENIARYAFNTRTKSHKFWCVDSVPHSCTIRGGHSST